MRRRRKNFPHLFSMHDRTNKSTEVKLTFLNIMSDLEFLESQVERIPEVILW